MTTLRSIAILLVLAPAACWAQFTKTTEHPLVAELTTKGFEIDGAPIKLLPPLVTPDMPADEQRAAFAGLVSERRMEKYLQDSVVASYKLDIDDIGQTAERGTVRRLDLYFVVHGSLQVIHEKELLSSLMGGEKTASAAAESGFETYAKPLDESAERPDTLPPAGELTSGMFRYRFPILEKVVVSGLASSAGMHVDGGVVQSAVSPRELLDDPANPTEWRPIPRGAKTDAELGPPEPFKGFYCYLHATQLGFVDNAVLVECHAAYIEPYGWFRGRNLLASKLPLLMQQNVRDFRRKLKEVEEKANKN
ncbi:hypothetical protein Pla123a_13660 [Posidoniimonas polymericola]|uniref:Uncharacterized protein n=1 Tax=Posidoniimonas polymericola TaxID=2528002 RepID=A0A5C5YVC4_9BACT|nr:hypothetical protein [Posidoniimonas polymericola]TWT78573.1 hypothetical protein Pla123a_13660 [Posidoniimonas polymericola]